MPKGRSNTMMRADAVWKANTDTCNNRRCGVKFTLTKRPHHCRFCGDVFCDNCAPETPLPYGTPLLMENLKVARKCNSCRLPLCFKPHRHKMDSKLDAAPMNVILSFLDPRSINALLQSCSYLHRHFHIRDVKYFEKIGDRFPSYFKLAQVGKGGQGTVFKLEDRDHDNTMVCVKTVLKSSVFSYNVWERLFGEIDIMAGNDHINIAGLREVFQTPEEVVIVMEAGEGGSLKHAVEVVRRKNYNMEVFTAHVVAQVTMGLEYLHSVRNVAHRDVKQDNIVLSRDFTRVMLIDFGLAEYLVENKPQFFVPCGTIGFASPENIVAVVQRQAKFQATPSAMMASDIFSLGVVAFNMLSGSKPLKGTRFSELYAEVRRGLRCSGPRWGGYSEEAKQLIEWMLHSTTHLRATPTDVLQHPWIRRNIPLFTAIESSRREEMETEEAGLEEEWCFVGAKGLSEEWGLVTEEEVIEISNQFNAKKVTSPNHKGEKNAPSPRDRKSPPAQDSSAKPEVEELE